MFAIGLCPYASMRAQGDDKPGPGLWRAIRGYMDFRQVPVRKNSKNPWMVDGNIKVMGFLYRAKDFTVVRVE